jgi:hypothetical protein
VSSTVGAALLTVALTAGSANWDRPALPRPVLEAGLKTAKCTVPQKQARILGTERLSRHLRIVEVQCWETDTNAGSILFAVPVERPEAAELVNIDRWVNGQVKQGYSVPSPGFDAATRTLSSTRMARDEGDCGTIQEMQWTGWHFRLLHVWRKDRCDGEPFEWDGRERWQVFPQRGREHREKSDVRRKTHGGDALALR